MKHFISLASQMQIRVCKSVICGSVASVLQYGSQIVTRILVELQGNSPWAMQEGLLSPCLAHLEKQHLYIQYVTRTNMLVNQD